MVDDGGTARPRHVLPATFSTVHHARLVVRARQCSTSAGFGWRLRPTCSARNHHHTSNAAGNAQMKQRDWCKPHVLAPGSSTCEILRQAHNWFDGVWIDDDTSLSPPTHLQHFSQSAPTVPWLSVALGTNPRLWTAEKCGEEARRSCT